VFVFSQFLDETEKKQSAAEGKRELCGALGARTLSFRWKLFLRNGRDRFALEVSLWLELFSPGTSYVLLQGKNYAFFNFLFTR